MFFWLREGVVEGRAVHVGFVASSKAEVDAAYAAALQSGAVDNGAPGAMPKNCNRSPRSWTFLIACSTLMTRQRMRWRASRCC